jgi:hypothetical protein
MTATCTLCRQIIPERNINGVAGVPMIGDPNRNAAEYQAAIVTLLQHVQQFHGEAFQMLSMVANTYFMHLIAQLGQSSDPAFEEEREAARAICYWSLRGQIGLANENRIVTQ